MSFPFRNSRWTGSVAVMVVFTAAFGLGTASAFAQQIGYTSGGIPPRSSLLTVSASQGAVAPGDTLTYTVVALNNGNMTRQIDVEGFLDPHTTFSSINYTGELLGEGHVIWRHVYLDPGIPKTLTVTVIVSSSAGAPLVFRAAGAGFEVVQQTQIAGGSFGTINNQGTNGLYPVPGQSYQSYPTSYNNGYPPVSNLPSPGTVNPYDANAASYQAAAQTPYYNQPSTMPRTGGGEFTRPSYGAEFLHPITGAASGGMSFGLLLWTVVAAGGVAGVQIIRKKYFA